MAAPRIRRLITAQGAFDSVLLQGHDGQRIPWDVVMKKLAELFRYLASAFAGIREWAAEMERRVGSAFAVALPAAAMVALAVLCCCCCCYFVTGGRRRPRGPDGEEVYGYDGPVVRYGGRGGGGYRGGVFSMHPNKPIVC